jgi:hypothetical protein
MLCNKPATVENKPLQACIFRLAFLLSVLQVLGWKFKFLAISLKRILPGIAD